MGFARFKSKHHSALSVRFTTGATGCEPKHAVLARWGRIKLHEDASALVGKVDVGTARVLSAAVRFERGRWFVSFTVDTQRPVLTPARADAVKALGLPDLSLADLERLDERQPPQVTGSEKGRSVVRFSGDVGSESTQRVGKACVTAVDVMGVADRRLAVGDKASDDQRGP